ncbi:MAG: YHS domain-containing protein [Planctomycetaceae bacterium]|nr:YHS domain-containing protein [Planctomycetaceae bacterium]
MLKSWYGLALLVAVAPLMGTAQAASNWHEDLNEARAEAQKLNRPMLLHFGAEWCVPCQKMERTVLNQKAVLQQFGTTIVGVKIDVDDHPDLVRRFGVSKFPTDLYIEPTGELLMESQGMHPMDEYISMMHRAGSRYADLLASRKAKTDVPIATVPGEGKGENELASQGPKATPIMDGYCPVTLWKHRRWTKGSQQFTTDYKGQQFTFVSEEALEDFQQDPERYVPRFLGCDPVIVWDTDRAVPGKTAFGAFYDDELYLFVSDANRKTFKSNPDKYIRTRVVLRSEQIERSVQ